MRLRNANAASKYNYQLVVLDDECKPSTGVQVATKAAADQTIVAGITHYCSAVAIATMGTYHRFNLPIVVWGSVLPEVTYGNKFPEVHRVNGTMIDGDRDASKFMRSRGYKTWVVIHDTTDYGKGHLKYFSEALNSDGGQIIGTFAVSSDQQDFTAELTKIKSLKPDVVYVGGLVPLAVRVRSQMEKVGVDAQFQGTGGILSDGFIAGLGKSAEGALAFREGAAVEKLPGGQKFLSLYENQGFEGPPEAYGPFAFAASDLLIDVIEKVGPSRSAIIEELNAKKEWDSIIGKIAFDDHGQNTVSATTLYVVQDGKWQVWDQSEYASGKRHLNSK